jgi:hypothetical protein
MPAKGARKTRCINGHSLIDSENIYILRNGAHQCRTCRQNYMLEYNLTKRERKTEHRRQRTRKIENIIRIQETMRWKSNIENEWPLEIAKELPF